MTTTTKTKPLRADTAAGASKEALGNTTSVREPVLGFAWLGRLFAPKIFLVSAVFGFLICCGLGYLTTLKNQYGDIPRFGVYVGPQASLFPTASQLLAYTKAHARDDQVLVVVGGSSVMNGVGQSNEQLWTKKLQQSLGDKFAVVNLAMRSCSTYEVACFIAEAMLKQHRKVIFVTGTQAAYGWSVIGRPPYAHYYWDAKFHDLLLDFPERDQALKNSEKDLPSFGWTPESLTELKLGEWLNSKLYQYELWNTVGHRYFFTSYSAVAAGATELKGVYWPRKKLPQNMEAEETFPLPSEEFARSFFPTVLSKFVVWNEKSKQWEKTGKAWDTAQDTIRTNLVPQLRPHTLLVLSYYNPYFRHKYLTKPQQHSEKLAYSLTQDLFKKEGVRSIRSGDAYNPADFRDPIHLSPSGGQRLAIDVAKEVKEMAKELGYLK